ncbi:DEAD/DEAH box helicase family protein [Romboutsia sedimentorum]|uniref:DEAD/DEAH box helicase n=1 Tax=Romboutsia sedimentorum TaxID=1368474 RepID=UPI0024DF0608|nr:DEAD/DEAH box helicase family protein [Romboutsia sedimentorum]MDK2584228.1 DEAD/DEAH box helicase family protein [Romboutsia sedimentorum]
MGIKLDLQWVREVVGEDWKQWKKGDMVKINAQTGTGKTYFIIGDKNTNGLIDNIGNKTLLYICNRRALKREIKLDLLKKFEMDIPRIKKTGKINMNKIDTLKTIKNVTILSYQELASMFIKNKYTDTNYNIHEFDYIICDECHFFLTDSGFNNKTYIAFFNLVREHYPSSVRLFISATIDEVNNVIDKALEDINEEDVFADIKLWDKYNTGLDYSYLNVKYFNRINDISKIINNDKSNEKWLVFVKSEDDGNRIKQDLLNMDIDVEFIMAKDNNEEKTNISDNNKFNCRVLISTKVLDNGINIKDDELRNIVVMAYDKTTFIQEIGRLRINIEDAKLVNLYIPIFSEKVFSGKLKYNYLPKIETIELLREDRNSFLAKYSNDLKSLPNDIFYLDNDEKIKVNLLGHARLYKDKWFAEDVIEKFRYDKFAYIKEQLKWIGLESTFNEENLIEMVVDEEVMENLESFLTDAYNNDERFTKEFFLEKIDEFLENDSTLREELNKLDNGKSRNKGMKKLNELFEKVGLDLIVSSKKFKVNGKLESRWIVSEIIE